MLPDYLFPGIAYHIEDLCERYSDSDNDSMTRVVHGSHLSEGQKVHWAIPYALQMIIIFPRRLAEISVFVLPSELFS